MMGKIIGFGACLLCAIPFFIISIYDKTSSNPINFWSGDKTLQSKVKDVQEYNKKMAGLYKKCAAVFLITGIGCLISLVLGIILLCLDCTLGLYLMCRNYKKILASYS